MPKNIIIKQLCVTILFLFGYHSCEAAETLGIMAFNVLREGTYKFACRPQYYIPLEKRVVACKKAINENKPDLIGLSECTIGWVNALKDLKPYKFLTLVSVESDSSFFKSTVEINSVSDDVLNRPGTNIYADVAFMYNSERLVPVGEIRCPHYGSPGLLSQKFKDLKTNQEFISILIHAPWGQGMVAEYDNYHARWYQEACNEAVKSTLPVIAMGDWNTDDVRKSGNSNGAMFDEVFNGFFDLIMPSVEFTARWPDDSCQKTSPDHIKFYADPSQYELKVKSINAVPEKFKHLLAHEGQSDTNNSEGAFDPLDRDNHSSDHRALIVNLEFYKKEPISNEKESEGEQQ